ncbi:Hypothetical protein P9303_15531 [Prochlorococcus marinus str. MIT 9303]|uniref:Uncharacterized protein n=1 Tax=Prochlorococcus marinus (strain MIT 9303) TaxID=59922 RepID=A2C9Y7_PROM3|nr:Hypothetical protein P9303_15531 [Prochlorococcus marinus str. MIT 9303]
MRGGPWPGSKSRLLGVETAASKKEGFKYRVSDRAAFTLKLWLISINYSEKLRWAEL